MCILFAGDADLQQDGDVVEDGYLYFRDAGMTQSDKLCPYFLLRILLPSYYSLLALFVFRLQFFVFFSFSRDFFYSYYSHCLLKIFHLFLPSFLGLHFPLPFYFSLSRTT